MRIKLIVMMLPLLTPALVRADPVFISDGATHDINSPTSTQYDVTSGTVNVLPGAELPGITLVAPQATVVVWGGAIEAGMPYPSGIALQRGSLDVSGGVIHGADGNPYGGDAVDVMYGTATISGGTMTGGNVSQPGGLAAGDGVLGSAGTWNGTPYISVLNISGGTFTGGTGAGGYYGGTTGYSLESLGDTTVSGGRFLSPVAINTLSPGAFTRFLGTNLSFSNGILSGTLENGDPINVRVYGTYKYAIVNPAGTEVTFTSVNPVPEPSSVVVFGALGAVLGIGVLRRRPGAVRGGARTTRHPHDQRA